MPREHETTPPRPEPARPAPGDVLAPSSSTGSEVNLGGSGEPHEAGRNSGLGSEETRRAD